MKKIDFYTFIEIMECDVVQKNACIEISFCLDASLEYSFSWLGKTINPETGRALFWYRLVADGSQSYDFDSLQEFISTPIIVNKCLEVFTIINGKPQHITWQLN